MKCFFQSGKIGMQLILKEKFLNYKITANFKSESIIQIMEMIQFCSFVDYSLNGNKVTLRKRPAA